MSRAFPIACALAMVFAGTACGGDDDDPAARAGTPSVAASSPAPEPSTPPATPATCEGQTGDGVMVDEAGRSTGEPATAALSLTKARLTESSLALDATQQPKGELRVWLDASNSDGEKRTVLAIFQPSTTTWQVQAGADDGSLENVQSNPSVSQTGRITIPLPTEALQPLGAQFSWRVLAADLGAKTGDACPAEGDTAFPG